MHDQKKTCAAWILEEPLTLEYYPATFSRAARIFRRAALLSRSGLEAGWLREDSQAVRQFLRAACQETRGPRGARP